MNSKNKYSWSTSCSSVNALYVHGDVGRSFVTEKGWTCLYCHRLDRELDITKRKISEVNSTVTRWYNCHKVIQVSPGDTSVTRWYNCHKVVIQLSPGDTTVTKWYNSHLVIQLSPGDTTVTWWYNCHKVIQMSQAMLKLLPAARCLYRKTKSLSHSPDVLGFSCRTSAEE